MRQFGAQDGPGCDRKGELGCAAALSVGLGELEPLIVVDNRVAAPVTPVPLRLGVEPLKMTASLY
jgi:hypothetical protein